MDDGAGVDRLKPLCLKRERIVYHKEIADFFTVEIQVKTEAEAFPRKIETGDPVAGEVIAEELPDIVAGPAAVIEKRPGPFQHPRVEEMPFDPRFAQDRKDVGVRDAVFFVFCNQRVAVPVRVRDAERPDPGHCGCKFSFKRFPVTECA
ncbi:MAG: hypothetical protein LUQ31_09460 [Methanoregula sp.]|nr:hypothetical protein [Methanoregula sp.]